MRVFYSSALNQQSSLPSTLEHRPPEELGGKLALSMFRELRIPKHPAPENRSYLCFMIQESHISHIPVEERDKLSLALFWDVPRDRENISRIIEQNPEWLIERVFEIGTMEEIRMVIDWYGADKVKEVLCQAESLSKICVAFAASLFDLKKDAFKCYRYKRSHPIYY